MSVPDGMKVGQRWKATRGESGVVGTVFDIQLGIVALDVDGHICNMTASEWSWEHLPDPEPEYVPGQVVRCASEMLWERTDDGRWWLLLREAEPASHDWPLRPLVAPAPLLVPQDGEK